MILFNFNAYRATSFDRIKFLRSIFERYDADIVSIQEIHVKNSLIAFRDSYHVLINIEKDSRDGIGIVTLIRKNVTLKDVIVSDNGRIIGVTSGDIQHWNIYPKSGTNNRNLREVFFNEELTNLMTLWRYRTRFTFVSGDFNCTHRLCDSRNNSKSHLQPGLCQFMKNFSLDDDFVGLNLNNVYSRETLNSATRIDLILSNSKKLCNKIEYLKIPTLDHKPVLGYYDIDFNFKRNKIPSDRFYSKFIFPRYLEDDTVFLKNVKSTIDKVFEERTNFKDPTLVWSILKKHLILLAKSRSKTIVTLKNERYKTLLAEYYYELEKLAQGTSSECHISWIIGEINQHYQKEINIKIMENKIRVMRDHYYDIHKDQRNLKIQGCNFVQKLVVDDVSYEGSENIINAVYDKMSEELKYFGDLDYNDDVTDEESKFLDLLDEVLLTDEEKLTLNKSITLEEISYILDAECDPDSAPGDDGISFRFLKIFWQWSSFQVLYLEFLNHTKENGLGCIDNSGTMILINKKGPTFDYNKKRKLTLINKDSNCCGKVWVNRFKKILADKIIPSNQFVCQSQTNIIDELCQIRNINNFLSGDGSIENDGSILSIDFANAFRSLSLRWLFLVLKKLNLPEEFIFWTKSMYSDLGIKIVLNNWKSSKILNERGLMEGHPCSSFLFVVGILPLLIELQKRLKGIDIGDNVNHNVKGYMDDLKCFLKDEDEIFLVDNIITKFEKVSGLIVHRDPTKLKCNILCFGKHRQYRSWPSWVNVSNKVKIVGAIFSNLDNIELINSKNIESNINMKINDSYGMKGTLLQKVYFLNIFILSKLNYLAQVFILDKKILININKKILRFLYKGENERPVQSLNYRGSSKNGLNLVHPIAKSKSLLLKSMIREFNLKSISVVNDELSQNLYGYQNELIQLAKCGKIGLNAKALYEECLNEFICRGSSLIPSRIEKKSFGIKWKNSYKNVSNVKCLSPLERDFLFKFVNDLLPVGARLHSQANKNCKRKIFDGTICDLFETREHFFRDCTEINESFLSFKEIVESFLNIKIRNKDIFSLSFMISDKKKCFLATWFLVKCFYYIYDSSCMDCFTILTHVSKEIDILIKNYYGTKRCNLLQDLSSEIDLHLSYSRFLWR